MITFFLIFQYITNENTIFSFRTNKDAPNYRIINIDFESPNYSKWATLVPVNIKITSIKEYLKNVYCIIGTPEKCP